MDKLVNWITVRVCDGENFDDDKIAFVKYGIELMLLKIIFFGVCLVIGAFMGMFFECVVYLVLFTILRTNAGGYHADTRIRCFIQSMLTMIVAMLVLMYVNTATMIVLAVTAFLSGIAIILLAPVDSENKRLEKDEIVKFKTRSIVILIAEVIFALIMLYFKIYVLSSAAMLAITMSGILLAAGYKKSARHNK